MLASERGPVRVIWCALSGLLDHLLLSREEYMLQVQERGWGTLGGVRSVHNVTALMNTFCMQLSLSDRLHLVRLHCVCALCVNLSVSPLYRGLD